MSSGFVSEAELEEKRRLRQEEWEKVRQADEPEEAPEEPFDHRSLFDRLEEQKQKKQMDYEEAHKLKNMIKGLDDDEVEFLDFVDRKKIEAEQLKELEEKQELMEFRKHVEKLKEASLDNRIQAEIRSAKPAAANSSSSIRSQHKLLQGVVVKRKSNESQMTTTNGSIPAAKRPREDSVSPVKCPKNEEEPEGVEDGKRKREDEGEQGGLMCVGILPGLGHYAASSDSDSSSSLSDEPEHTRPKYDLLGRKLVYQSKDEKQTHQ